MRRGLLCAERVCCLSWRVSSEHAGSSGPLRSACLGELQRLAELNPQSIIIAAKHRQESALNPELDVLFDGLSLSSLLEKVREASCKH